MYQPKVREDQVRKLYHLARSLGTPMTALIREAVDQYLENHDSTIKGGETNEDHP